MVTHYATLSLAKTTEPDLCSLFARRITDGQSLEAGNDRRLDPRRLAGEFDRVDARQQLLEKRLELHPCEISPRQRCGP